METQVGATQRDGHLIPICEGDRPFCVVAWCFGTAIEDAKFAHTAGGSDDSFVLGVDASTVVGPTISTGYFVGRHHIESSFAHRSRNGRIRCSARFWRTAAHIGTVDTLGTGAGAGALMPWQILAIEISAAITLHRNWRVGHSNFAIFFNQRSSGHWTARVLTGSAVADARGCGSLQMHAITGANQIAHARVI